MHRSVIIVDDDHNVGLFVRRYLERNSVKTRIAHTIAEARKLLTEERAAIALVDYHLPDGLGAELIRWATANSAIEVAYCITGDPRSQNVVDAMRAGAIDVIEKPFEVEKLERILALAEPASLGWRERFAPQLLGDDPGLLEQIAIVENVSDTDSTVLVFGESGTGKELIARAVHDGSPRKDGPFVPVNCAAIPESLIEDELFGHTRGAFTGAEAARQGRIASAHGGTLFLDEIGDMPLVAQAKLLRVLQERTVTPLGGDRSIPVDLRVVAATNRDLEAMVEAGTFRADLLFRLRVIEVHLPPLRDRGDDILTLARSFLALANRKSGRVVTAFDPGAESALLAYGWPGNVRELANTIERAVILKRQGTLSAAELRLPGKRAAARRSAEEDLNLRSTLEKTEKRLITLALERSAGNRTEAAALLGLNRTTLVEKMKRVAGE